MTGSTITLFGAAFGLSMMYSLVPGPVTVEALRRGARGGVRAVVSVRAGSLAGSLVWAVVGLTGAGVAMQNPHSRLLLGVAGTSSSSCWRGWHCGQRKPPAAPAMVRAHDMETRLPVR